MKMTRPNQDVSRVKSGESNQFSDSTRPICQSSQILGVESTRMGDSIRQSNQPGESNQLFDSNQISDSTNLQDPIETKCRQENFALAVQFLRSVQLLRRSELTTQWVNNFAPAGKIYVAYDLPQRSELTRQPINFYIVQNLYVELILRREEIIPKYERNNFAPARQCPHCVQPLRRSQLAPKELIPRCQQDNFAPTGFEIPSSRQVYELHLPRE